MSEAEPRTAIRARELRKTIDLPGPWRMNIYVAKGRDLERALRLLPAGKEPGRLQLALALASVKCTFNERCGPPEEKTPQLVASEGEALPPKTTYGPEVALVYEELIEFEDIDCLVIMGEVFSGKGSSSAATSPPSKPKDTLPEPKSKK